LVLSYQFYAGASVKRNSAVFRFFVYCFCGSAKGRKLSGLLGLLSLLSMVFPVWSGRIFGHWTVIDGYVEIDPANSFGSYRPDESGRIYTDSGTVHFSCNAAVQKSDMPSKSCFAVCSDYQ